MAGVQRVGVRAVVGSSVLQFLKRSRTSLAYLSILIPGLVFAQAQMSTPGSFAVSSSGAATYTIPLQVPPGTAGMQPSLALSYNGQAGNGLAGVGWSLSGSSSIHRCPRSYVQDGSLGGVNYDANDRLCLDGDRLVLVGGTYGFAGSEYRTEHESFSKIVMGAANDFEVRSKSGQIMHYRSVAAAPPKTNIARQWVLDRVTDRAGNYMTYTYTEDTANGVLAPSRIDYTGSPTTATYSAVVFVYGIIRTDVPPMYEAGAVMNRPRLLTNIQTFVGANLVKDYQLAYEFYLSPATSRQRLSKVTVHGRDGSNLDIQLPGPMFT